MLQTLALRLLSTGLQLLRGRLQFGIQLLAESVVLLEKVQHAVLLLKRFAHRLPISRKIHAFGIRRGSQ